MSAITEAAHRVRAAVEADEAKRFVRLTQAELDAIPNYQSSLPTSPRPGFRYRKKFWRAPNGRWWTGPYDSHLPVWEGDRMVDTKSWPIFWMVYEVRLSDEPGYVDHVPREARVVA